MKSGFLILLFLSTVLTASAQNIDGNNRNNQVKDDLGTTPYGLPVHKSYVAPDVVERAKKKYGRALYSIEKSSAASCQESYLIGLIRKGKLTIEWMCDDPKLAMHKRYTSIFFTI